MPRAGGVAPVRTPCRRIAGVPLVAVLVLAWSVAPAAAAQWFLAGAAKVDVTPPPGYPMMLGGKGGLSTGIHVDPDYAGYPSDPDRLYARALALSWAGTDLILVALDNTGITLDDVQVVRKAIGVALGIDARNVIVSSTHTHNAPDLLGPYGGYSPQLCLPPPDGLGYCATHYREQMLFPGIVQAAVKAYRSRERASLRVGQVDTRGLVFNRRVWTPESRTQGLADAELTVLQFEKKTARHEVIATVANFSVHMVPAVGSHLMSADTSGYLVTKLEHHYGGVGLFVPGAFGNQNPAPYFNAEDPYPYDPNDPNLAYAPYGTIWDDNPGNPYQDPNDPAWDALDPGRRMLRSCWDAAEEYAQKLTDYAIEALGKGARRDNQPDLRVEKSMVKVPMENPGYTMMALPMDDPVKVLARTGAWGPTLAFLASFRTPRAVYVDSCATDPVPFPFDGRCYWIDTEVFAVRIGPVAFATVPGELFSETQLILKSALPGSGFVVALAPEELGYIAPTHYVDAFWSAELLDRYGPIPALDYWGSKGPNDYESRLQAVTSGTGVMTQLLLEALFPMIDRIAPPRAK